MANTAGRSCCGRFVPATENAQLQRQMQSRSGTLSKLSFEEWLRETTTATVDTEINIQLGEFTLKKHKMQRMDAAVEQAEDFVAIFGLQVPSFFLVARTLLFFTNSYNHSFFSNSYPRFF